LGNTKDLHMFAGKMRPLPLASISSSGGIVSPDALEPIAVVGLATHFPQQATSTESLWELLLQARSTWSSIPKERFNSNAFYHPDPEHGGTVSHNPLHVECYLVEVLAN
jgi:hypothetical protein